MQLYVSFCCLLKEWLHDEAGKWVVLLGEICYTWKKIMRYWDLQNIDKNIDVWSVPPAHPSYRNQCLAVYEGRSVSTDFCHFLFYTLPNFTLKAMAQGDIPCSSGHLRRLLFCLISIHDYLNKPFCKREYLLTSPWDSYKLNSKLCNSKKNICVWFLKQQWFESPFPC